MLLGFHQRFSVAWRIQTPGIEDLPGLSGQFFDGPHIAIRASSSLYMTNTAPSRLTSKHP